MCVSVPGRPSRYLPGFANGSRAIERSGSAAFTERRSRPALVSSASVLDVLRLSATAVAVVVADCRRQGESIIIRHLSKRTTFFKIIIQLKFLFKKKKKRNKFPKFIQTLLAVGQMMEIDHNSIGLFLGICWQQSKEINRRRNRRGEKRKSCS